MNDDVSSPPVLRPLGAFLLIALCLSLSSCQCSWDPDVGPVDDEESAAATRLAGTPGVLYASQRETLAARLK